MHSSRLVFSKSALLLALLAYGILSPSCGQSVSVNVSDFTGQHFVSRLAYCRWRSWLLDHPAVLHKAPPVPIPLSFRVAESLNIHVSISPTTVLNVDDAGQTVTFSARLDFWWLDEALAVDSDLTNAFTDGNASLMPYSVTVPATSLWMPPLFLLEGVNALEILRDAGNAFVTADGKISIFMPYVLTVSCGFDMEDYPFDEHDCSITLTAANPVVNVITTGLQWDRALSDQFSVSGEWDLIGFMSTNATLQPFGVLYSRFVMRIKRKTMFYGVVIVLSMVLTSYLNVLVFLLPPDLGDKTSYLVTINISLSVFTSFFSQGMPRGLDTLPQILQLLVFVLVESVISLVLSLIVLRKYKTERDQQQEAEAGTTSGDAKNKDGLVFSQPDKYQCKTGNLKGGNVLDLSDAKNKDGLVFSQPDKYQCQTGNLKGGNVLDFSDAKNKDGLVFSQPDKYQCKTGSLKGGNVLDLSAKQMDLLFFVVVLAANTVGIVSILVPMFV